MGNSLQYKIDVVLRWTDQASDFPLFSFFSFVCFVCFFFVFTINFLSFRKFIYFATTIILQCGEKLFRVAKITGLYLSYSGRANFSNISLQNEASRLHERQKVGLARMVIRLALSPFFDGKITLLARPTFSLYKPLCSSRRVNSVKTNAISDNHSMGERCWVGQRSHHFFLKDT